LPEIAGSIPADRIELEPRGRIQHAEEKSSTKEEVRPTARDVENRGRLEGRREDSDEAREASESQKGGLTDSVISARKVLETASPAWAVTSA
jgi:hypothetical protein